MPVPLLGDLHDGVPLDEAAATLAASEAQDDSMVLGLRAELDQIAASVRMPDGIRLVEQVARLNHALFNERGFAGDDETYDAPENSLLNAVLERRRGLPILLSIVVIGIGRRVGVPFEPIAFPGHFLVTPRGADPRFFVDPFRQGAVINDTQLRIRHQRIRAAVPEAPDYERTVSPADFRAVLARVCNNLALSYVRRDQRDGVSRMLRQLKSLTPFDGGMVASLQHYLDEA